MKYDVVAIFDLTDGIDARQLDLLALLGREFRAEDESPVVEPAANDIGAQLIGGRLEDGHIVNRYKGVVVLAEADLGVSELMLDEVVAVEVVGGSEREERSHTHHDRAEHFVVDVKIVVGEATPLVCEDAVIAAARRRARQPHREHRSGRAILQRIRRCLDAQPFRTTRRSPGERWTP